jgi:hypothetical protein
LAGGRGDVMFAGDLVAFVRDQVGGALSYAAVPRVGLGPTPPPLCRYAECTTDLILQRGRVRQRLRDVVLPTWRGLLNCSKPAPANGMCIAPERPHHVRCPGAWFGRRSGIKEESSAISRHGGQPRSRPSQAPGRTLPTLSAKTQGAPTPSPSSTPTPTATATAT